MQSLRESPVRERKVTEGKFGGPGDFMEGFSPSWLLKKIEI